MEVSTSCDAPAQEHVDASGSGKQSLCKIGETAVVEPGDALRESQQVENVQELMSGCSLGEVFWCEEKEANSNQKYFSIAASEKVLAKSGTFPCTMMGDDERRAAACNRSISLPTCRKLVSAMKGGRERQVGLTVTWDPDVYDPPATSLSHTVNGYTNNQQRSKNSKKKKRKGRKSSSRKHTASSSTRSQSNNNMFHEETTSEEYLDFSVTTGGLQDCGTSFLRTFAVVGEMHIPFAEAT